VRVELYADGINAGDPVRVEMKCAQKLPDSSRRCVYHATVSATRQAGDYTVRVIPQRAGAAVPLESARILWQRWLSFRFLIYRCDLHRYRTPFGTIGGMKSGIIRTTPIRWNTVGWMSLCPGAKVTS